MKTNAARLLDKLGIRYELVDYEVDLDDLSATSVARKVGMPPERVYKTLVARGAKTGVCFAVVPAHAELDLKALARAAADRSHETVPLKEVQPLTGYIRGGVTVFGAKRAYPVYLDAAAKAWETISVSAGVRGTQIFLAPNDYARATSAIWVPELARALTPE